MQKHHIKHDDCLALVIDRPILEILHISADTTLELTTVGGSLLISPVDACGQVPRTPSVLEKNNQRFCEDLKRLAE